MNDELSTNLINAEFQLSKTNHSPVSSPRKEHAKSVSTKTNAIFNEKNNSTIQSHHTSVSIHTVVNELENQYNNEEKDSLPFNQFNTSYSSFKTNQDEESSSLTSLSN